MPTRDVITSADLDELRRSALRTADPLGVAADLADAVAQGRLAEPADAGDALTLAAEIAEIRGRLDAALRYADRALAAYPSVEDAPAGFARALRARILFRAGGRQDEAMAELAAVRQLLIEQPEAPAYVSAALDAGGQSAIAEEWLSEAVDTVLGRRATAPGAPAEAVPAAEAAVEVGPPEAPGVLFFLLQQRHRVRRDLNLPHDRQDDLADRLEVQLVRRAEQRQGAEPDLLFWPRAELDRLLAEHAELTEAYGPDWDAHRGRLERHLVEEANTGRTGLTMVSASVDGLTGWASRHNGDPTDPEIRTRYARELATRPGAQISWPPERNDACWCGSGLKYKKCCLPRSRG
ncbi:SEC-C metal-binding domain-containing protein [Micromonospora soli]|uniref:SEC-C metal-binding domain-containing protein n=1 Tax=Micromonospora sp. NBRC 110009 TaxID=3061627 RepID=UPI0026710323|nr:SEC-C metal-binding domain-containing protein [Micromonospora sp. NBRC 110009]WKT98835.1 SEC-C metal-binding domain-containing protein [Micromonospora sp. NBRC 110009]